MRCHRLAEAAAGSESIFLSYLALVGDSPNRKRSSGSVASSQLALQQEAPQICLPSWCGSYRKKQDGETIDVSLSPVSSPTASQVFARAAQSDLLSEESLSPRGLIRPQFPRDRRGYHEKNDRRGYHDGRQRQAPAGHFSRRMDYDSRRTEESYVDENARQTLFTNDKPQATLVMANRR